jgi:hypothetical protein
VTGGPGVPVVFLYISVSDFVSFHNLSSKWQNGVIAVIIRHAMRPPIVAKWQFGKVNLAFWQTGKGRMAIWQKVR